MKFNDWVFSSLVKFGAIKDYSVSPKASRGKRPKGNLSIQIQRIAELRGSKSADDNMWGMIAYAGLQSDGQFKARMIKEVDEFSAKYNAENPPALVSAMKKAALAACSEFKKRYKETKTELMDE